MPVFLQSNAMKAVFFILGGVAVYQVGISLAAILVSQAPLLSAIYLKSIGAFLLSSVAIVFIRRDLMLLWRGGKRKALFLLLGFSVIDSIGWVGSVYYNGLTGIVVLGKLVPIILIAYGVFFLKEKLSTYQIIAGLLTIVASAIFSVHALSVSTGYGLIFHGLMVFGYCGFAIMQKRLAHDYDPYSVVWARAAIVAISVIPLTSMVVVELHDFSWLIIGYFLALGTAFGFLNGFVKHAFMMKAFALAPLSWITLIKEISGPLVFLIGIFIFNEEMTDLKWIATGLAAIVLVILVLEQYKSNQTR